MEFDDDSDGHSPSEPLPDPEPTASFMPSAPPDRTAVAAAIERRLQRERAEAVETGQLAFDDNHEKRQQFRRMIDPDILRPNARELALEALAILLTLAENILNHPAEEKYYKFKPTNARIKRLLVDPKGTLEYAVALGFRPEVENFQPFYKFNKRHMSDLRIGAAILKEALDREMSKEERMVRAKRGEKAAAEAAKLKVKQAFIDDRKSKAALDQRERQARAAAASRRANTASPDSTPVTPIRAMPGSGHTLRDEPDIPSSPI
ncbi:hypothetical protein OBBRIDRAFT_789626 [Obba rivulosa]|uniref:PUB domain-containing protein n=1 Tax=Obba rivulosa TaxID=1052685 RepID=A0A8E2DQR6_9APHY|nr:hypothetical protein OBBRIDRAFT_789626 [Obba rivulosa]